MRVSFDTVAEVACEVGYLDSQWRAETRSGQVQVTLPGKDGGLIRLVMTPLAARQLAYMLSQGAAEIDGRPLASYGRARPVS